MQSNVSDEVWEKLLERDDRQCLNCLREDDLMPAHYIAHGRGGSDELDNLMLLCFECHRMQHDGKLQVTKVAVFDTSNPAYAAYAGYKFFFRRVK